MTERLVNQAPNTARSSVVVSITQLAASLLGGLFALLVALIVGEGDATDGFLAAYSAYLLLILFGSTMRISLVPMFGSTDDPVRFNATARRRVSEILPIAFVISLVFVALAPLLGRLILTGASDDAQNAAVKSIALLGVAASFQIWAAILASVLGGARRFVASSLLYLSGSFMMVVLAGTLMALYGIEGAGVGVALAAFGLAAGHMIYLRRLGFTAWPRFRSLIESDSWKTTANVSAGSVMTMVLQLNLTISIGFVAGATGVVSGYVYAYLLTIMATGVTAATIALVTLPNLVQSIARDGDRAARFYLRETSAFGAFLFFPVAAGFWCFGWPIVEAVLGNALSASTLEFFWDAARIFLAMGLIWSVFAPVTAIAFAQQKYGMLAAVAIVLIPVHVLLAALLSPQGELGIVVGHVVSGVLLYVVLTALLFGRAAPAATWEVAKSVAPCGLLALVFVIPGIALSPVTDLAVSLSSLLVCSALYLGLGVRFWPRVGGRMVQLLIASKAEPAV